MKVISLLVILVLTSISSVSAENTNIFGGGSAAWLANLQEQAAAFNATTQPQSVPQEGSAYVDNA